MPSIGVALRATLAASGTAAGNGGSTDFRKSVTVQSSQVPSNLTDFPVLLSIASDADLAANADEAGDNIYMTESDGTTLVSTEIEKWDSTTGELHLWFKAPSLSSSVDTVFYLHYGSTSVADNGRDPAAVWANGYEAVYHMSDVDAADYTSQAIAEDGAEFTLPTVQINPSAYHYNGVTYIVYQGGGTASDPYILAYNHSAGTWSGPTQVGTNPLTDDWHGAPAVIVDDSGTIHVFFGNHNGAFEYRTSTNTEDISTWTTETDVGSNETYANLVKKADGTIYLISRTGSASGGDYTYRTSADTFVSETTFIDMDSSFVPYSSQAVYDSANERIHLAFYLWNGTSRLNLYHCYLDLSDHHVYAMDGTDLGTEVTRTELNANDTQIVSGSTSSTETQTPALAIDSSGNPHVIWSEEDGAGGIDWKYTFWNGTAWATTEVITTTDDFRSYGDLYFSGASTIEAYLSVAYGKTNKIEHWQRSGGTWSKVGTVLDPAKYPTHAGGVNHPHAVVDGVDGLRWVFCERGLTFIDYNIGTYEVFATDNNDDFVTRSLSGVDKDVLVDSVGQYYPNKEAAAEPAESASGQILNAQDFGGLDYARFPPGTGTDIAPSPTNQVTVEAWVKHPATTANREIWHRGGPAEGYYLRLDTSGKVKFLFNGGVGSATGATDADDDTFRHVAGTYDKDAGGTDEIKVFVNGVQDGVGDYSAAISYASGTRAFVGALNTSTNNFDGLIDELRISNVARSADWLLTGYNNTNSPGTFITLGSEEGL